MPFIIVFAVEFETVIPVLPPPPVVVSSPPLTDVPTILKATFAPPTTVIFPVPTVTIKSLPFLVVE